MDEMQQTDVLIIGAGISGLLCATELVRAGLSVQLIEKGRGFGGRMATRRMGAARLDHGAQFFTARDSRFQLLTKQWLEAGIIKEWFHHSTDDVSGTGHPRYCGVNGMTDVPKYLAEALEVHRSKEAFKLERKENVWSVLTRSGEEYTARHLVITAPLPQALNLVSTSNVTLSETVKAKFSQIHYEKGLATLAILDGPSGLPEPGGMKLDDGVLTWIADNRMKGISPDVTAVTLHANSDFATKNWDSPNELRGQLMLDAAKSLLKSDVVEYNCHRWGFTTPINPFSERYFMDSGLGLTLAGDAFGGPRIEGAALSGLEASEALVDSLK